MLCVSTGWALGEFMSFSTILWHFYLGFATGALLLFRCLWGLIGPRPVQFRHLFPTRSELSIYLRQIASRSPSGTAGHNPLGSLSVVVMLLLLTVQVASGLFIESDDFFESAPLAHYASEDSIGLLTWIHHLNSKLILLMVALHVGSILFYLIWKKENLIRPMITGWKWVKRKDQ